jgi:hypothetical protein
MQILHPQRGSIQQYMEQVLDDVDRGRPRSCPQCLAREPMTAHGFYNRTIVDEGFDGVIRIRRYLCGLCLRTVSLLPEWALPYLRFSLPVIARTLKARLMENRAWKAAAPEAPYQRGQHWVRRFTQQAEFLSAAMTAMTTAAAASCFVYRVLGMLEKAGWTAAHRFLFSDLRIHLLGWPSQYPRERRTTIESASSASERETHNTGVYRKTLRI